MLEIDEDVRVSIDSVVESAEEDGVIFVLLLTEQCNFECGHCFYSCSPQSPNLFMSDEVLNAIWYQMQELKKRDIPCRINLIGGEPTLNLQKFGGYLNWAMTHYRNGLVTGVEMTTNGWWLKELRWVRKFMEVIGDNVYSDEYGLDGGFTCRISNDQWHDAFRPSWLQGEGRLAQALASCWEPYHDWYDEPVLYPLKWYECYSCGQDYEEMPEDNECADEDCNGEIEAIYDEPDWRAPPNPEDSYDGGAWIYVESTKYGNSVSSVIPVGRGTFGHNDKGANMRGSCASNTLTYKPDGTLSDICCSGSNAPFGTAYDNPLVLLALAQQFVKDWTPICYDCHRDAEAWADDHLESEREYYKGAIECLPMIDR